MGRKKRNINILKIAEEANVSMATVSRVMNRRVGVSEENRARIDKLLKQYAFTTNYSTERPPKIAVLCPDEGFTYYLGKAINGVFQYARTREIDVSIITQHEHSRAPVLKQIRDQQCSGVIVLLTEHLHESHLELNQSELPVVYLDAQVNLPNAGYIDNDSYSGSCAATKHLLELGHTKIGYLQYNPPSMNQIQRQKGYENTLRAAGIEIKKEWIFYSLREDWSPVRGVLGRHCMRRLLEQAPDITAVQTVDDGMALGALRAIHESGRRIPQDISIVGFDNWAETEAWYPALTTVDHPVERAGFLAAESIYTAINQPGEWTPPREILPTQLVIRDSTGPAPCAKPTP